jgi:hypothetical protein
VAITLQNLHGKYEAVQLITDDSGLACSKEVREGTYRVDAWKPGFLRASFQPVSILPRVMNRLTIVLPFGEINEGGISEVALVIGTLTENEEPVQDGRICFTLPKTLKPVFCVDTDRRGEYAASLLPGAYEVEVSRRNGKPVLTKLSLPAPGIYRNKIRASDAGSR